MVQKNNLNKLLIICGPTASGKTELAIECAKLLNSEIISADSMNVYKNLNIGTAKPTTEEMSVIKHHLINVVEPNQSFSVGDYKETAMPIVNKLLSENKVPIICGGTGFYINSLIFDLSYGNSKQNLQAREKYLKIAEENGADYVYQILQKVDYEASLKIHKNDIKRVVRALEIYESGFKKSDIKDEFNPIINYDAYSIDFEREELYKRIDCRVDSMINKGLIEEVKSLMDSGIDNQCQCMQGIGYKEIYSYLKGEYTLNDAIELIKLNTRHYAKRQITFFKKLPNLSYIKPQNAKELAKRIVENL